MGNSAQRTQPLGAMRMQLCVCQPHAHHWDPLLGTERTK